MKQVQKIMYQSESGKQFDSPFECRKDELFFWLGDKFTSQEKEKIWQHEELLQSIFNNWKMTP